MFRDSRKEEEVFISSEKGVEHISKESKKPKRLEIRKEQFGRKNILATGGVGSIGSEIVRHLLKYNPKVVRIFDNDETGLFNLQHELKDHENVRYLVGDVRDKERLKRAVENIDIIFHAAALKHVPSCEYNPFEAIKTNVIGTQNVVEVAMDEEVEKMINISTDKVVNPIGTMGATKLLTEKLIVAAEYYKGDKKTIFSSVRFGNVIGTRGSVVPLFMSQIKKGKPVTITNPNMTRFVMSIKQAVGLIFKAAEIAQGGEIFIFKMHALRLSDLTEVLINELSSRYGYEPSEIEIKTIGIRPGERMYESLMTEEEANQALETEDMFIILPQILPQIVMEPHVYQGAKPTQLKSYTSNDGKLLTKEEIKKLLSEEGLL